MLKLKIDLTNPAHVSAAAAFFNELNSCTGANKGTTLGIEAPKAVDENQVRALFGKCEELLEGVPASIKVGLTEQNKTDILKRLNEGVAALESFGTLPKTYEAKKRALINEFTKRITSVEKADKLQADKLQADKPQADKPQADKPQDGEVTLLILREITTKIRTHENPEKKRAAKQWLRDNGFENIPGVTTDKYQACFDAFTKILNE